MAYLNGKPVDDSTIDPAKHKFIGLFREPYPPDTAGAYYACTCGQILQTVGCVHSHWQMGHMDKPQYVDVDPSAYRDEIKKIKVALLDLHPDEADPRWRAAYATVKSMLDNLITSEGKSCQ